MKTLVALLVMFAGGAHAPSKVRNKDAEVIEASLLQLYKDAEWQSPDWKKGRFVVLRPKYSKAKRPDFSSLLDGLIRDRKADSKGKPTVDLMTSIRDEIAKSNKPVVAPEPLLAPTKLQFDRRIVVSSEQRRSILLGDDESKGIDGRFYFYSDAPCYSSNGQFAILGGSAPWSIHSADIYFILRLDGKTWKVVDVETKFYV